ncbi:MAG: DUF2786 domain-containing protein [Nannocystaceae bacterium]
MNDHGKILDRVRKLLRLATSDNLNEAANAAARAQDLVDRHRIDALARQRLELEASGNATDGIVDARDRPIDSSKRLRRWKTFLAQQLGPIHDCRVYMLEFPSPPKRLDLVAIGRPDDIKILAALYEVLIPRIESLTRKHGEMRDRKWRDGFRLGAVQTVTRRLADRRQRVLIGCTRGGEGNLDDTIAPGHAALMLREIRETLFGHRLETVDAWIAQRSGDNTKRGRPLRASAAAFAMGELAAHDVDLED